MSTSETAPPRSWRPEMKVDGVWYPNGLRFATEDEAKRSALALFMRWTAPSDHRAAPSTDHPCCALDAEGVLTFLVGDPEREQAQRDAA